MKYPIRLGTLAAVVAGCVIISMLPTTSEARIGERRESIESRLFSSGGIVYRDDAIEATRRNGMPYLRYFEYLPSSADVRVYFKTVDGRRPTSSELEERRMAPGWDLHVVYVGGKSVIEVYKRSQAISEHEFNYLMALNAGGSFWKRPSDEEKEELVSAFGVEMIRDDGQVRARKLGGDAVLFVDSQVDTTLVDLHTANLEERAPASVEGF